MLDNALIIKRCVMCLIINTLQTGNIKTYFFNKIFAYDWLKLRLRSLKSDKHVLYIPSYKLALSISQGLYKWKYQWNSHTCIQVQPYLCIFPHFPLINMYIFLKFWVTKISLFIMCKMCTNIKCPKECISDSV